MMIASAIPYKEGWEIFCPNCGYSAQQEQIPQFCSCGTYITNKCIACDQNAVSVTNAFPVCEQHDHMLWHHAKVMYKDKIIAQLRVICNNCGQDLTVGTHHRC